MIESIHYSLIKQYGPGKGTAGTLGDQQPSNATGFTDRAALFKALGYTDYVDIDYNGEARVNLDLNFPLPEQHKDSLNLVYDGGVAEHVSNIGECFKTLVSLCRVGGVVIQAVPIYCYGASYYGIDPMMQKDFFEANGFETLYRTLYVRKSIRSWLFHLACRLLPKAKLYWTRDKLKSVPGFKSFVLYDTPKHIKRYKPPEREEHSFPHTTHTVYVGCKRAVVPLNWPHQTMYPSTP